MMNLKEVTTHYPPDTAYNVLFTLIYDCGEDAVKAAFNEIVDGSPDFIPSDERADRLSRIIDRMSETIYEQTFEIDNADETIGELTRQIIALEERIKAITGKA